MLNLAEGLLGMGRTYQQVGRVRDALTILSHLSRFRELPKEVAEETQARLGEIQLQRKHYVRACRHLRIALSHDPENPRYHRLLATGLRRQGHEQWEIAATHYQQALRRDSEDVDSLTELGLLLIRMGRADQGIAQLRRAVELRPTDPAVLGRLAKGLRRAGRQDEARSELCAARFANPNDRRFETLWRGFQFQRLFRQQQSRKQQLVSCAGPVLLAFPQAARENARAARPLIASPGVTVSVQRPVSPGRPLDQRYVQ
jgi:Tfp pilus assembly protein PilF